MNHCHIRWSCTSSKSFSAKANNLLMWIENGSHNSPKSLFRIILHQLVVQSIIACTLWMDSVGKLKTHNIYLYISSLTNIQTAIELHVKWHSLLWKLKLNIGNWSIDTKGGQLGNYIMKATLNRYELKWKGTRKKAERIKFNR